MNDKLKKQFVSYNIALELKSIGFDELYYKEDFDLMVSSPTYSQVIDWFEENHNIYIGKTGYDDGKSPKRWVYHVDNYYIPEQTLENAIMYAINKIKNK